MNWPPFNLVENYLEYKVQGIFNVGTIVQWKKILGEVVGIP